MAPIAVSCLRFALDLMLEGIPHTSLRIVNASDVVHASSYEVLPVWRPREVIDLSSTIRSTHDFDPPMFQIFRFVLAVGCGVSGIVRRRPKEDIAVVACRGEKFTYEKRVSSTVVFGLREAS
jgi:hypothetical protein